MFQLPGRLLLCREFDGHKVVITANPQKQLRVFELVLEEFNLLRREGYEIVLTQTADKECPEQAAVACRDTSVKRETNQQCFIVSDIMLFTT